MGLSSSEDCMIVAGVVLAWYQRVTDRRSDGQTVRQTESIMAKTALCIASYADALSKTLSNKKALLSQRWPRDAPYIYCMPWKFSRVPEYAVTFPEIFNGLLFLAILWMCVQNLKFLALPVPEIIGGIQKIGQSLYTPTLRFIHNF